MKKFIPTMFSLIKPKNVILSPVLAIVMLILFGFLGCDDQILTNFECAAADDCDYWHENVLGSSCKVSVELENRGTYNFCISYTGKFYKNNGEVAEENCENEGKTEESTTQRTSLFDNETCSESKLVGLCNFNIGEDLEVIHYLYESEIFEADEDNGQAAIEPVDLCGGDFQLPDE